MALVAVLLTTGIGWFWLDKTQITLTRLEQWLVAVILGYVMWSVWIYITAWLGIREIGAAVPLILGTYGTWKARVQFFSFTSIKIPILMGALIMLGTAFQLFLVAPSGITTGEGVAFYGINFHDGVWHVALMELLQQPFPPANPISGNVTLTGYHYLVDLFGSEWARLFGLSPLLLTFRLMPALFALITGAGVWAITRRLKVKPIGQAVAVVMTYLGGSFSYALPLLGKNTNPGESAFWAQQAITTYINLPLGISFAVMLIVLVLVLNYEKTRQPWNVILAGFIAGSVISIKAYGGLLLLVALGGWFLHNLIKKQHVKAHVAAGAIMVSISLLLVFPSIKQGAQTFVYEPGWFLKTMMEAPDRFNYPNWEKLRLTYVSHGNYPRLIQLWGTAFLLFIGGNMGMRLVSFPILLSRWKRAGSQLRTFLGLTFIMILIATLMPMLFIQAGTVWNTVQFFYYALFFSGIYTGIAVGFLPSKWTPLLALGILILALPSNVNTVNDYASKYIKGEAEVIEHDHVEALVALKLEPEGMVLAPYYENAYITAFSGKPVWFGDKTQADILLLESEENILELRRYFIECKSEAQFKDFINHHNIRYVYADDREYGDCTGGFQTYPFLTQIFGNDTISIYRNNE
jgi:hypothetical protein